MFTGIVEEMGVLKSIRKGAHSAILEIQAKVVLEDIHLGDSIAVNGVCLTATSFSPTGFTADVMHETLNRSSLASLRPGHRVNLERAMAANGRFGGHIVAGHVDGVGTVQRIEKDDNAIWYTIAAGPEVLKYVVEKGSIQSLDALPAAMRKVFVTAMDIDPVWHLRMQAAFQRHTDNAVSKTVNLPHSATEQDIHDIYWLAYKEGCKGVTVYRDGCKSLQVLATGEGQKKMDGEAPAPAEKPRLGVVRKRPEVVQGFTQKIQTGLGAMYLTVNEIDGKPFEVFATIGKSGRSITAKAEAIGRLVSLALRSGVEVRDIVAQIKGIGGEHPVFRGKGLLLSIPDAIAWVLERRYLKDEHLGSGVADIEEHRCPECDEPLVFQEGCLICPACGFSRCG